MLGQHAQETYDLLIFNVLAANSNVSFVGGGTAITQLTSANVMSYAFLVELAASLQDAAARPFDGGDYVCVVAPQVKASLLKDSEFLAAHQFNNTDAIYRGEFGAMAGLRVVQSNAPGFAATSQAVSGYANLVYTGFAVGKSAYQIADLQNLKAYVVAPGGQADPLQQKRQMGYKFAFKSIITNTTWINTFFSAGNNTINHA